MTAPRLSSTVSNMAIPSLLDKLSAMTLGSSSATTTTIALVSASAAMLLAIAYIYLFVYRPWTSPFRNLPGPDASSLFWGNIKEIINTPPLAMQVQWLRRYGRACQYRTMLGGSRLLVTDLAAMNYVMNHPDQFPKPSMTRRALARILGEGVLVAEGAAHKRQRRILNPSFSAPAVKDMMPIFYDKAYELRNKFVFLIEDSEATEETSPTPAKPEDTIKGGRKIDVMKYLGQASIDIIGLAGFGYDFKGLSDSETDLWIAFRELFQVSNGITAIGIIQALVPYADRIPTKQMRTVWKSKAVISRVGRQLLDQKKNVVEEMTAGKLEKGDDIGKDLLSIIVRANMGSDVKTDQRLTDDEVMAQILTFLFAGNETSSTALTWVLWELAKKQDIQDKLRVECQSIHDERPGFDALATLPYLENVVREVLRVQAPAPATLRAAAGPSTLPLADPVRGRDGKMMDHINVNKGTSIFLPLLAVNMDEALWGPDAAEFNPDRYNKTHSEKLNNVPGTWGNLMTFGGGPHNCIGYRFALAEIKAILFVLVRSFNFELLPSNPTVERKQAVVMRPRIVGEEKAGLQMPLMVKPLL